MTGCICGGDRRRRHSVRPKLATHVRVAGLGAPGLPDVARAVNCGECLAFPGERCPSDGEPGSHLARYLRANARGLITDQAMTAIRVALDPLESHGRTIVPDSLAVTL